MKAIVSDQESEFSLKVCIRKCKQTSNLLLINCHLTKKSLTDNLNFFTVY